MDGQHKVTRKGVNTWNGWPSGTTTMHVITYIFFHTLWVSRLLSHFFPSNINVLSLGSNKEWMVGTRKGPGLTTKITIPKTLVVPLPLSLIHTHKQEWLTTHSSMESQWVYREGDCRVYQTKASDTAAATKRPYQDVDRKRKTRQFLSAILCEAIYHFPF